MGNRTTSGMETTHDHHKMEGFREKAFHNRTTSGMETTHDHHKMEPFREKAFHNRRDEQSGHHAKKPDKLDAEVAAGEMQEAVKARQHAALEKKIKEKVIEKNASALDFVDEIAERAV